MSWKLHLFSLRSADYYVQERRCKHGETPCALCGRSVEEPWPHTVQIVDGGAIIIPEEAVVDVTDPGYLGCWPVGERCWQRVLAAIAGAK